MEEVPLKLECRDGVNLGMRGSWCKRSKVMEEEKLGG